MYIRCWTTATFAIKGQVPVKYSSCLKIDKPFVYIFIQSVSLVFYNNNCGNTAEAVWFYNIYFIVNE